jgi:hypothetical protein
VAFVIVGFGCSHVISDALRALLATENNCRICRSLPGSHLTRRCWRRRVHKAAIFAAKSSQLLFFCSCRFLFVLVFPLHTPWHPPSKQHLVIDVQTTFVGCGPCKTTFALILGCILFTPEFQQIVMIIASTSALLVALWGMTGVKEFERLPSAQERLRG